MIEKRYWLRGGIAAIVIAVTVSLIVQYGTSQGNFTFDFLVVAKPIQYIAGYIASFLYRFTESVRFINLVIYLVYLMYFFAIGSLVGVLYGKILRRDINTDT